MDMNSLAIAISAVNNSVQPENVTFNKAALIEALKTGKICIEVCEDQSYVIEDLEGDAFYVDVNSGITLCQILSQREIFRRKVEEEGVWVLSGRFWNGRAWQIDQDTPSVGGLVGVGGLGCEHFLELLEGALEAYNAQALDPFGFVLDPHHSLFNMTPSGGYAGFQL